MEKSLKRRELTEDEKADASRLKALLISHKAATRKTQEDVAEALDMTQSAVSHYANARAALGLDAALRFVRYFGLPSLAALSPRLSKEFGQDNIHTNIVATRQDSESVHSQSTHKSGRVFSPEEKPLQQYELGSFEEWDDDTPLGPDEVEVPLYNDTEFAAGNGAVAGVHLGDRKLRFARSTMRRAGVQMENAACAVITGDSMEPKIGDGATVGIDVSRTLVKDGRIYALDHDGLLRVKRLYRLPGGGLRLRSDNPAYQDEDLQGDYVQEHVKVLGWVFWISSIERW